MARDPYWNIASQSQPLWTAARYHRSQKERVAFTFVQKSFKYTFFPFLKFRQRGMGASFTSEANDPLLCFSRPAAESLAEKWP